MFGNIALYLIYLWNCLLCPCAVLVNSVREFLNTDDFSYKQWYLLRFIGFVFFQIIVVVMWYSTASATTLFLRVLVSTLSLMAMLLLTTGLLWCPRFLGGLFLFLINYYLQQLVVEEIIFSGSPKAEQDAAIHWLPTHLYPLFCLILATHVKMLDKDDDHSLIKTLMALVSQCPFSLIKKMFKDEVTGEEIIFIFYYECFAAILSVVFAHDNVHVTIRAIFGGDGTLDPRDGPGPQATEQPDAAGPSQRGSGTEQSSQRGMLSQLGELLFGKAGQRRRIFGGDAAADPLGAEGSTGLSESRAEVQLAQLEGYVSRETVSDARDRDSDEEDDQHPLISKKEVLMREKLLKRPVLPDRDSVGDVEAGLANCERSSTESKVSFSSSVKSVLSLLSFASMKSALGSTSNLKSLEDADEE